MPNPTPNPVRPAGGLATKPYLLLIAAIVACMALGARAAQAFQASHELTVTLHPQEAGLSGVDRITITDAPEDLLAMGLNPRLRIRSLKVNGSPREPARNGTGWALALTPSERRAPVDVVIRYEGRFQDEAPDLPVNTDNPGYGVSGTIGPRGTLLLGGSGWYPAIAHADETVQLRAIAPQGTIAVTAGRSTGVTTAEGKTISGWRIDRPIGRLALSAGRYTITTAQAGTIPIATYFLSDEQRLADTYLQAAAGYLALYETRFGPYPFPKFAIVENFFPTGYGFPSYTLIGGRVLRLPFIVETSLGHEIAHCWWGNGVRVDRSGGNWSEGLTSYVAEHLYQEMESADAARRHRRQLLRNYATLVGPGDDFSLRRFTHRFNPPTKAIGYDKGAMVFHMLRQTIGDKAFGQGLRRLYACRLHQETGWNDLQRAFEHEWGHDLNWFFRQWIDRQGAPSLWLEAVQSIEEAPGRYRVQGVVRQDEPFYRLSMPLAVSSRSSRTIREVAIDGPAAPFSITVTGEPTRIEGDPQSHVFRRLVPEEIPAAINALRRSEPLLVIVPAETITAGQRQTAQTLALGLGRSKTVFRLEKDLDLKEADQMDILVMGTPRHPYLTQAVSHDVRLAAEGFDLHGETHHAARACFFGVWRHPRSEKRFMAVMAHGRTNDRAAIARKIPHYGAYSYLVFEDGINRAKGVWEPASSPLVTIPREGIGSDGRGGNS